jgi:hypothetical protein
MGEGIDTRLPMEDADRGIATQTISWVTNPTLFILMHEPPARRYGDHFVHWHYSKAKTDYILPDLATDPHQFISPILFVDGHSAKHDFTAALKTNPRYPYEATKDWMWYKPVERTSSR